MNSDIWEGIYKSFKDVPETANTFESPKWINSQKTKFAGLFQKSKTRKTISGTLVYTSTLLPVLTAVNRKSKSDKIKILDFGGGLGITYLQVINALSNIQTMEYHIVENKKICELGEKVFANDKNVYFHPSLPNGIKFDIIYTCSVLQYVDDWKGLLNKLKNYRAEYFLFMDLPAGDIPTYVTSQNYYGLKIPYRFYNIQEILSVMRSINYRLLLKSIFSARILAQEQELLQNNFPQKYRLGQACNLLFQKDKGRET